MSEIGRLFLVRRLSVVGRNGLLTKCLSQQPRETETYDDKSKRECQNCALSAIGGVL
jgi:hypothetical protein